MNKILTLDFETQDPYISRKLGAGWAYGYNVEGHDFIVLGAAVQTGDGMKKYVTDFSELKDIILRHDSFVAHNASYELGCLHFLYREDPIALSHIKSMTIYDTMLMGKMVNSSLMSYSLDALAKKYLRKDKQQSLLCKAVWENNLYPLLKKEEIEKARAEKKGVPFVRTRPAEAKLEKFAYENMKLIQDTDLEAMAEYALSDVHIAADLYNVFVRDIEPDLLVKMSKVLHVCVGYRLRGVRVNLKRAWEIYDKLTPIINAKTLALHEIAGATFNVNSSKELPPILAKLGIKPPKTPLGAESVQKKWLEQQSHPICKAILEVRKYKKIQSEFIKKIIDMQHYTGFFGKDTGRVFPEIRPMGAATGRFAASCPNIQQIPSRDEELAPLCRSLFEPDPGKTWFSIDFSSQEIRLQVHYAYKLGCTGADILKLEYDNNPRLDTHQAVADMVGITRKEAKVINLGLSYGMGVNKLAGSLSVTKEQAYVLRDKYNQLCPYLFELNNKCIDRIKKMKYIRTIWGRKVHLDPPVILDGERVTFEYKALNKLIQGSAADQTMEAMIQAYDLGLEVMFPVHDELCMQGTVDQANQLADIMRTCIPLAVPVEVDIEGGPNWGNIEIIEATTANNNH